MDETIEAVAPPPIESGTVVAEEPAAQDPAQDPAQEPGDAPEQDQAGEPVEELSEEEQVAASTRLGPGVELNDDEIMRRVCALIFASPEPLSLAKLVQLLERPEPARVRAALDALGERLESSDLPLSVRGLRGGYTLMTTADMGEVLARLAKGKPVERVSPAALETLAVIAYRQPVTKAEVEAIRGVQAGPVLRSLVDRGLVRVVGRAEVPGHPLQYGTTKDFLDRFGLMSLEDLPRDSELAR